MRAWSCTDVIDSQLAKPHEFSLSKEGVGDWTHIIGTLPAMFHKSTVSQKGEALRQPPTDKFMFCLGLYGQGVSGA